MDKEKQINEITKVIARRRMAFRNSNIVFMTTARKTANSIYNTDYRKQREVVREVFEDIENNSFSFGVNFIISKETLAKLKKKYTE